MTPTILGTARLLRLLDEERLGPGRIRVILNRFNGFEGNLSERTVVEQLGRDVDHVVPYDRSFVTAATRGRPILLGRPASAVEAAFSSIGQDAASMRDRPAATTGRLAPRDSDRSSAPTGRLAVGTWPHGPDCA